MSRKRAFLISFEGIEGTGKSTQSRLLINYLKKKGLKVSFFREPGSSSIGEDIRNILLHGKGKITPFAETLLFAAARGQLCRQKIRPVLWKKDVIILDRYYDATAAYQGYGSGCSLVLIEQLNKFAVEDIIPDLTILLDISPRIGLKRSGRGDRFERRKINFHEKVRNGYLQLAKKHSRRIKVVPVAGDILSVQKAIEGIVINALDKRRR